MNNVGIFTDKICLEHKTPFPHCENEKRLKGVLGHLDKKLNIKDFYYPSLSLSNREYMNLVHTNNYISFVKNKIDLITNSAPILPLNTDFNDGGTFISSLSFEAARGSVNTIIEGINDIKSGIINDGFCLVRPPGHHASFNKGMGFCIFNNIAIGARYLQTIGYKKIMIIDHDIHHGNGTQEIFYNSNNVYYFSTHHKNVFPGTGNEKEEGQGEGLGFNKNIILGKNTSNNDLIRIYKNELEISIKKFNPDFILISSGFDLHKNDFLSDTLIDDRGIEKIFEIIMYLTKNINSLFVLEGGYNIGVLKRNIEKNLRMLLEK